MVIGSLSSPPSLNCGGSSFVPQFLTRTFVQFVSLTSVCCNCQSKFCKFVISETALGIAPQFCSCLNSTSLLIYTLRLIYRIIATKHSTDKPFFVSRGILHLIYYECLCASIANTNLVLGITSCHCKK